MCRLLFLSFYLSVLPMGRMQQSVGSAGQWFLKEFRVHLLDIFVLVREPHVCVFIQVIQRLSSVESHLLPVMDRLAASSHASAGTGHHLHEIIMDLPPLNPLDQVPGIHQAADGRSSHCDITDSEFRFLDPRILLESLASHPSERV